MILLYLSDQQIQCLYYKLVHIEMLRQFKIRSKSQANARKYIYKKIIKDKQQDKWFIFLSQELGVQLIINDLSKAQFDRSNLNKFKYAGRSILMMKKDIIYQLEQSDIVNALIILKQLTSKVNQYEKNKFKMTISLLQCKLKIEKGLNGLKEEELIKWLKTEISQYGNQYDCFIIKVTLLTILSILLIHNHGILMSADEKLIVFKTIELKKKTANSNHHIRTAAFQCLLYLLSEIYKIIYLLKKDQQTILSYYNQLNAYTQTYSLKNHNASIVDIKEIQRILKNMKPILNQLNIYEDSELRKEFAFLNLKNQILSQHNHCEKDKSICQLKKTSSRKSSLKVISVSNLLKINHPNASNISSNANNVDNNIKHGEKGNNQGNNGIESKFKGSSNVRKLELLNYKSEALYRSSNLIEKIAEGISFLADLQKQQKIMYFLTIHRQHLYLIMLKLNFRNSCSILDIEIQIKRNSHQYQTYLLKGIEVLTKQYSAKKISKFIEKLFFLLFTNKGHLHQLNHIQMAEDFIPHKLATEEILISIIRIKALLKHYIKTTISYNSLIPTKIIFPNITLHDIQNKFQSQGKKNDKQQLILRKRQGKIIHEYSHAQKNNEISLRILYKIQHQISNTYIFFSISYIYQFKGINIYLFSKKDQVPDVLHLAKKLQKIWYKSDKDIKKKLKEKIISQVQKERVKIEQIYQIKTQFSVELQIMLSSSHNKSIVVQLNICNDLRMGKKEKLKEKKHYEMIKINNKYILFEKLIFEHYMMYSNVKSIITLPLNWQQLGWQITTSKIRMYKSTKIVKKHGNSELLIITSLKSNQIVFQYRHFYLKMLTCRIIRKQKGYCLLLEYMTPELQYLYQVIVNPLNRFFCLSEKRKTNLAYFHQHSYINNNRQYQYYHLGKQKLSQANHYYQNFIKNIAQ